MKKLALLAAQGKISEDAGMRDRQSVVINAAKQKVWSLLSDIANWPSWNPEIKHVKIDTLAIGKDFTWKMNGHNVKTTIRQLNPPDEIAWTSTSLGVKSVHTWRLEGEEDLQTIITTEESIEGILTVLLSHSKFHRTLVNWLECLKKEAEKENLS